MTRKHAIAVGVGLVAILIALVPPVWIRATGTDVAVALRPVDPLSVFRGNYVDLDYDVQSGVVGNYGEAVYIVFDDSRPANVVGVAMSRPELAAGETCIRGEYRGDDRVGFPELEQYFVTAEQGAELEGRISDLVGIIKTTNSCRAVLTKLEPK